MSTNWNPESFSNFADRLKSDPSGASNALDLTVQFLNRQIVAQGSQITALQTAPAGRTITLQTNGVTNTLQTVLNLIAGTNITLTADGSGGVTFNVSGSGFGTVTSVGLSLPAIFSVSGSPVTTSGTLSASLVSQLANLVWASPNGAPGLPTFRALVTGDLPYTYSGNTTKLGTVAAGALTSGHIATWDASGNLQDGGSPSGSGTVTSVALTMPTGFSVTGSPVTTSGTLAVTADNESANTVWAGPTTGAAATPAFRALVAADLPGSLVFYGTDTGSANAWAATITGFTLATGVVVGIKVANAITGATTLAVNGGAAKNVTKYGASATALYAGDFIAGDIAWLSYDGTQYQVINLRAIPTFPVPLTSSYSWVNQGSATSVDNTSYLKMLFPAQVGLNVRFLAANEPSTPYTVIMKFGQYLTPIGSSTVGLYFYDGTKIMGIEPLSSGNGAMSMRVEKYTNTTTGSSTPATENYVFPSGLPWRAPGFMKLQNTGTNLNFFYSLDGDNWVQLFTEAIGTFITPTQYGFGGAAASSASAFAALYVTGLQTYAGAV